MSVAAPDIKKDLAPIAKTALRVMFYVALEQYQPSRQRIIHDDLARHMLPRRLQILLSLFSIKPVRDGFLSLIELGFHGTVGSLCRKRYIDDKLLESFSQGVKRVVNLGAGLDTRAYRFPELSTSLVYEIDLPQTIAYKQEVLKRVFGSIPSHVRLVPINFDQQSLGLVLKEYDYSTGQKTFFIWEGVTQYISESSVRKVFDFISTAKTGSRVVFSYILKDFVDGSNTYNLDRLYKQTSRIWQFGMIPSQVGAFIGEYSWKLLEDIGAGEYRQRYLVPLHRNCSVMEIERMVYAEKQ